MKKVLLVCSMVFSTLFLNAGSWNPYVAQGIVNPAPLLPFQLNGTGVCSFNVGNSGSDPLTLVTGEEMLLKITLSKGLPNNVDPIAALGGTWKFYFNWTWDAGTKTYTGTQNQTIPGGPIQGDITIQYKVTANTTQGSPNNGFNVNITPPAYTGGYNITTDDAVSSYTYTEARDYGDAPISYGEAYHLIDFDNNYSYLGTLIDNEAANQATANALGDDIHGFADEDGVTFPALVAGAAATIIVKVTTSTYAILNAWIDWNGDGDFADVSEQVALNVFCFNGNNNLLVNVPLGAVTTGPTFARFRLGPFNTISTGPASWGEVEDYQIQIYAEAYPTITKTDGTATFLPGTSTVYTVVVGNVGGAAAINGALVNDPNPAGATITGWTTALSGGATVVNASGSGPIVNESVNLPVGGYVTYTITATFPCSFVGNLVNTASITYGGNTNTATDIDIQNDWKGGGTTDWNTAINWTIGVPNCYTIGAEIPAGTTPYPIINTTGNFTANLNILNGATLTINPAKDLKVCGCTFIKQQDGLYLKSDPSGNAAFIDNGISYATGGTVKVDLYLTSCQDLGAHDAFKCWHYVSPPIYDAYSGVFTGDYLKYYIEPSGAWSGYVTATNLLLNVTQGYAVSPQSNVTRTFDGHLNTSVPTTIVTPPLTRNAPPGYGWNLVGNPFPSPIDLSLITFTNVDQKAYFLDQGAGNYKIWYSAGGSTGTQYPLSMQGFFVHVPSSGTGTLTFPNTARTIFTDHGFYKSTMPDQLLLKVEASSGMNDEMVVTFRPDATSNYDNEFDCSKLFGDKEAPQLYSVATDASKLTINSMPYAGINTVVPLEFSVDSNGTGNYSITASRMETFHAGTTIILEDKKLSSTQELTTNPIYTFSYADGDDPARFFLHFHNPFFGIDNKEGSKQLVIYSNENNIYVKDLNGKELQGQIMVYDLVGQEIAKKALTGGTINKFSMNLEEGYYVIEVFTNDNIYHGKVYLTR